MSTIVLRNVKGSPLTFTEMDDNFTNLNNDKADKLTGDLSVNTYAGPYTFSHTVPATGRHEFFAATTGGWENYAHTLTVQYDLSTTSYFSLVDAGGVNLLFCMLHQDPALSATNLRGNGILMGNCDNSVGEKSISPYPTTMAGTWMGGTAATYGNSLFNGSEGVPDFKLRDTYTYRVRVQSTVDHLSQKWVRYQIFRKDTSIHPEGTWKLERDTGHLLDFNAWADFTKTGVMFGQTGSVGAGWGITLTNVNIVWGPPEDTRTANPLHRRENVRLGMFPPFTDPTGATVLGNYTFNMTGFDNTQIRDFASSAWDWNNIVDVGDIKALLQSYGIPAAYAEGIEVWVARPLYCMVAKMLYHMKQRGW